MVLVLSHTVYAQQSATEEWKNEIRKVYQLVDREIFTPKQGVMILKDIKAAARVDLERQMLGNSNVNDVTYYRVVFWGNPSAQSSKTLIIRDTIAKGSVDERLAFYFDDVESGYVKRGVFYKPQAETERLPEKMAYIDVRGDAPPVFDDAFFVSISVKGKVKGASKKKTVYRLTNAEGIKHLSDSLKTVISEQLTSSGNVITYSFEVDTQFTIYGGDIPPSAMNDKRLYAVALNVFGEGRKGWMVRTKFGVNNGGIYAVTLAEADSLMHMHISNVQSQFKERGGKRQEISGMLHVKEALVQPLSTNDYERLFQTAAELKSFDYPSRKLKSKEDLYAAYGEDMANQIYDDYSDDIRVQLDKAIDQIDHAFLEFEDAMRVFDDNTESFYKSQSVFSIETRKRESPASVYLLVGTGFSLLSTDNGMNTFAENDQRILNVTGHIGIRSELNIGKRWFLSSELKYSVHRHRFRRNNFFADVDGETDFIRSDVNLDRSSLASSYFDLQMGIGFRTNLKMFETIEVGVYGGAHSHSTARIRYKDELGYSVREFQRGSFNVNPYRHGFYVSFGLEEGIHNRFVFDMNPYFSNWNGPRLNIVSYALMVTF